MKKLLVAMIAVLALSACKGILILPNGEEKSIVLEDNNKQDYLLIDDVKHLGKVIKNGKESNLLEYRLSNGGTIKAVCTGFGPGLNALIEEKSDICLRSSFVVYHSDLLAIPAGSVIWNELALKASKDLAVFVKRDEDAKEATEGKSDIQIAIEEVEAAKAKVKRLKLKAELAILAKIEEAEAAETTRIEALAAHVAYVKKIEPYLINTCNRDGATWVNSHKDIGLSACVIEFSYKEAPTVSNINKQCWAIKFRYSVDVMDFVTIIVQGRNQKTLWHC